MYKIHLLQSDFIRYILNGLVATGINYITLSVLIAIFPVGWVWLASALACTIGITSSFLGSHFFVFPNGATRTSIQLEKFLGVYAAVACINALVLFMWTDVMGWNWRIGFLLATVLQVAISYSANKFFVFK